MGKKTDFGDILAKEFKKRTKGLRAEARYTILNITTAGGEKRRVKVVDAGPDSLTGYIGNLSGPEFSTTPTVFNPDQIISYESA